MSGATDQRRGWRATNLWKRLNASVPQGDRNTAVVSLVMPDIEALLGKASTSLTDYTLHDEDHSLRVADWMARVIPPAVFKKLQATELALLLLTAYLHDAGMTPLRRSVRQHQQYLLTRDP